MKIAQVIASRSEGGLEKHVRELSLELVEQGHQVDVISDAEFLSGLAPVIGKRAVPAHLSRRNPWLLFRLYRELAAGQYDIIHAQANKGAALIKTLKPFIKLPSVGTLHNVKHSVTAFQGLDRVITVSRPLAEFFSQDRVRVVFNGIKPSVSSPVDLTALCPLPDGQPVILAIGRLVPAKGFDILLEAIDGLPVTLLIAGEGPERAQLEALIKRLAPPAQCYLLGQQQNIGGLMQATDAVVIGSRRDGFSYVFIEALASGKPVLASDVPGANEVLPSELIVPVGDAGAFRDRLESLLNEPARWQKLMEGPQDLAREEMTLKAMTQKTLQVYDEVLELHRHH